MINFEKRIPRRIGIKPSHNGGFIVNVGCGRFVYPDYKKLIKDLTNYLRDPDTYENEYNKVFDSRIVQNPDYAERECVIQEEGCAEDALAEVHNRPDINIISYAENAEQNESGN